MARSLNSPKADLRQITVTATLAKGGTGATTRKQAVINLGGIDTAQLGVPGGIVKLDGTGKIPVSQLPPGVAASVTLEGGDVYTNQNAVFVITNYDVKTTYAITVSAGTVSKIGNKITFSAPSTAQIVTMTVNGRAHRRPVCRFCLILNVPENPKLHRVFPVGHVSPRGNRGKLKFRSLKWPKDLKKVFR